MSTSRYPRNFLILGSLGRTTARNYATVTDLPRPPVVEESRVETFSGPSKPRLYYTRPPHQSDLPRIQVHALLPILRAYFTDLIYRNVAIHSRFCYCRCVRMSCCISTLHHKPREAIEFCCKTNTADGGGE